MATAKHFGAYGAAIGGRDYNSADISERTLQEVYLPPFYAAARAGAGSFMAAFNDIAGVPTTANRDLLRGLLRERWGWQGLMVSDWGAIGELINHGVAADRARRGHAGAGRLGGHGHGGRRVRRRSEGRDRRRIPRASNNSTRRCCASCA